MDWTALDRHEGRAAVYFSGGKDSTVVLHMMREAGLLDRVAVFHLRTSDAFPEMVEHVERCREWCPDFRLVETDPIAWAAVHGDPSDLVPHSAHVVGQTMGEGLKISARYDCCFSNLMWPMHRAVLDAGMTLAIRGTRSDEMRRVPVSSGATTVDGLEVLSPIEDWTEAQVWAYTREHAIPVSRLYEHFREGSAAECMTCPAWLNVDAGALLRERHPDAFKRYGVRLRRVAREVAPVVAQLEKALAAFDEKAATDRSRC